MKKLILTAVILSTLTMCKKADLQEANNTIANADSLMDKASETVNNLDSNANAVLDSVNLKAKDLIKNKEDIEKAFENSKNKIDSISENIEKFKKDVEDKKITSNIDSIKNQIKKEIPKATKTLTKVIYKDKPGKKQIVVPEPSPLVKNGSVEINVDNISEAKESLREIIRKYDGTVKTENLVSNDEFQTFYLTSKVPFEKFDYVIEDLQNLGMIQNKNLEVKGNAYSPNKLGNLEITLYDNHLKPQENEKDKTFGEKSADAISSGWTVIGSILLFLLPFWPVFLIAGIGYYFYKKKNQDKNQNPPKENNTDENV
ncbi:DUF4349 domain-containing protein [Epilithonimonas sp.]|uniref:DUF4349 domain-containing protein n=1 Tax=Epilithonimonas sp. TaxID=2894511 RepID=UPI00289961D6|nr:DUF4349 domain-containing protein [Epilithonimonas sp.]